MNDEARELLERVLNLWDTDDFIRDDDIEEIRAYLASEKQERQEPKYKVFVNDEGLWFSVGSQSFTIAYESDNIKELKWMKLQLEKALASIGAPIESNNIAKMIENSVPTRPLKGDIWKDTSVTPNEYYIWDGNRWLH